MYEINLNKIKKTVTGQFGSKKLQKLQKLTMEIYKKCKACKIEPDTYPFLDSFFEEVWFLGLEYKTDYERNKDISGLGDQPDYVFHPKTSLPKSGTTSLEIKFNHPLDKKQSNGETPIEQSIRYLKNSAHLKISMLTDFNKLIIYAKTGGSQTRIFKIGEYDWSVKDQLSNISIILYSFLSKNSPFNVLNRHVDDLLYSKKLSDEITNELSNDVVDFYYSVNKLKLPLDQTEVRKIVTRMLFISFAINRNLIDQKTVLSILKNKGIWSLFHLLNNGHISSTKLPKKFNGRLFAIGNIKPTLPPSLTKKATDFINKSLKASKQNTIPYNTEIIGSILEILLLSEHEKDKREANTQNDLQKIVTEKMRKGAFYSGSVLTNLLLNHLREQINDDIDFDNFSIFDMCVGSGSLLVGALNYFGTIHALKNKCKFKDSIEIILKENFSAIDNDPNAVELTLLNTALENANLGLPLADTYKTLEISDAIAEVERYKGKYNIIISNPPYLGWELLKADSKLDENYFLDLSEFTEKDEPDQWYFFIEKALQYLKPNGLLFFIVTDSWISKPRGKAIRKMFIEKATLVELSYVGKELFPNSDVNPCVITVCNKKPDAKHRIKINIYPNIENSKKDVIEKIYNTNPDKTFTLPQNLFNFWLDRSIPFNTQIALMAYKKQEENSFPLSMLMDFSTPRERDKKLPRCSRSRDTIEVWKGENFGNSFMYTNRNNIPKNNEYHDQPALLIQWKNKRLKTKVKENCPLIYSGIYLVRFKVLIQDTKKAVKVLEKIENYMQSDEFWKWYQTFYRATFTHGGYLFQSDYLGQIPINRDLAAEILSFETKQTIQTA